MSFFDVSNLAAKFGGLDIPEDPEIKQSSGEFGYTHTADHEDGYHGEPPTGYASGPQEGQEQYRSEHSGYSTSDPTRNGLGGGDAYSYNPTTESFDHGRGEEGESEGTDGHGKESPTSGPLPEGWVKKFDERYDRPFYVNEATGVSQWEPPRAPDTEECRESGEGDGGDHPSQEHDPDKPWYEQHTHAEGGEADGYYAGQHYEANRQTM